MCLQKESVHGGLKYCTMLFSVNPGGGRLLREQCHPGGGLAGQGEMMIISQWG